MMNHYNGPFCIKLPQMIEYVRCFDNNKTMFFKVIYDNLQKSILKYGKKLAV